MKTMPNFLIIGAAKSASTSLYNYLAQHPQIYLSSKKEPCFFSFEGQNIEFEGPGDQGFYGRSVVANLEEYQALFNDVKNELAIGEASVLYLYIPEAPARIKYYIPDVKLIAILRNPIDRAYSSFLHLRRDGREPLSNFADALQQEDERIKANWAHIWHYKQVGFYYTQLKRYFELFSPEQIAVYTYDEFMANPINVIQDICCFLQVDSNFKPDTSLKHNVSGTPRLKFLHQFLRHTSFSKNILKSFIPASLRLQLRQKFMKWNIDPNRPPIPEKVRLELIQLYHDDILQLQSLIKTDLSSWLNT